LLLIDQVWFEKVWTGEVVLVKRNYASSTIESPPSVQSDLRPGAQNTSDGVPTSLANTHPESRVRANKSHFGLTPALNGASLRGQIGEAQTTANTGSTGSAPATSVATGVVGQEHTLSQAPTDLILSSSSTKRFIALTVRAANTVIVWASILAIQTPILLSIANLVQTDSLKTSNVDRRQINKTNDRVENFLSRDGNDAKYALDRQSEQRRVSIEMPPSIELKPLQTSADSVNSTETKFNLNTMADVQQLSNGDPPVEREINKTDDGMEADPDIGLKSRNANVLSTKGNDATRALDRHPNQGGASTEMSPAIELKSLQTPADSVNRTETKFNLKTMVDVQQQSNDDRISRPEYQPPIQREINKTNDRMEVDSDISPKSKNTNFLSTNGEDATSSLAKQPSQRRASREKLPAIQSKSLRTPLDSMNRSEARFDLRTTADVQQVQRRLVELGYLPFLPDGVWGPHSIQALRAFRTTAGLGSGDEWDRKTEDILFATTAPKATAPTASPLQLPPG